MTLSHSSQLHPIGSCEKSNEMLSFFCTFNSLSRSTKKNVKKKESTSNFDSDHHSHSIKKFYCAKVHTPASATGGACGMCFVSAFITFEEKIVLFDPDTVKHDAQLNTLKRPHQQIFFREQHANIVTF